jgi:hypothetical protein
VVGKPGKKEGAVIPMVKEGAKKAEGIETLDGIGSGTDIQNLGEEIVEAEKIGRNLKPLDDLIDIEGFFDLEVQKNPDKGMSDQEVLDMLEKDLKEKETLEDFDPTDREPNAEGGLMRTKLAMGSDDEPLKPDPTKPINPFGPKPTGPVLPDKMAGTLGDEKDDISKEMFGKPVKDLNPDQFQELMEELERLRNKFTKGEGIMTAEFSLQDYMDEFERVFPDMIDKRGTQEYMDMLEDYFRGLASKDRTSGRVQAASGGLAEILKV